MSCEKGVLGKFQTSQLNKHSCNYRTETSRIIKYSFLFSNSKQLNVEPRNSIMIKDDVLLKV